MNLEQNKNQKNNQNIIDDLEFDFKPITSGLGFHHHKTTEIKSTIVERTVTVSPISVPNSPLKKEMNVYQNDLSLFYGQNSLETVEPMAEMKEVEEKYYRLGTKPQRVFAYLTDLFLVGSILGIVMTVMARTISMDLIEVWGQYPNEVTPLVMTLFCGFYLIYFSIFEKANQSTLGKNLFGLRVVTVDNQTLSLPLLLLRSTVSLLNFVSLGLFSYFDLQSKVTSSKVIRID
jgi:uncharacterized RDD family membrane protein YckC